MSDSPESLTGKPSSAPPKLVNSVKEVAAEHLSLRLERSASSNAVNPRTSWCPLVVQGKKGYEVHIMWKSSRNSLELYLTKGKDKVKRPFGLVVGAQVITKTNAKGEASEYFVCKNEYGDVVNFKSSMMNPGMMGYNTFSKKMIGLRADGQDNKLATYISQLSKCKDFTHFDGNVYSDFGFKIGEEGCIGDECSLFEQFVISAKDDATIVTTTLNASIDELAVKTKRKKKSEVSKTKMCQKLGKNERIEKYFRQELSDTKGVEASIVKNGNGRADIPLRNLSVSDKVMLPIDDLKVKQLCMEMFQRFEPTSIYLTVVPAEQEHFDQVNLHLNKYSVVHGRHRFLALQQLSKENKLSSLPTMEAETVTCYILGLSDPISLNYLTLRGNELAAKHVSKPNHHDLLYTLQGLKQINEDTEAVMKAITRYAALQKCTDAEKSSLRSLSKWPNAVLDTLKNVLWKYERFQTSDTDDSTMKKAEKLLKEGRKQITPITLFHGISKLPFAQFQEHAKEILEEKSSLKEVVQNYTDELGRKTKEAKIVQLAGLNSIEKVRTVYPEQFASAVIDKLPVKCQKSSISAISPLEKYTIGVFLGKTDSPTDSSELKTIELSEDVVELKLLMLKSKRKNVKELINRDIEEVEFKIKQITQEDEQSDPYEYKTDAANTSKKQDNMRKSDFGCCYNNEEPSAKRCKTSEDMNETIEEPIENLSSCSLLENESKKSEVETDAEDSEDEASEGSGCESDLNVGESV